MEGQGFSLVAAVNVRRIQFWKYLYHILSIRVIFNYLPLLVPLSSNASFFIRSPICDFNIISLFHYIM